MGWYQREIREIIKSVMDTITLQMDTIAPYQGKL